VAITITNPHPHPFVGTGIINPGSIFRCQMVVHLMKYLYSTGYGGPGRRVVHSRFHSSISSSGSDWFAADVSCGSLE